MSDNVVHAVAGAGGGILSMALTYPLVTISTRAQVESRREHTTTPEAVKAILAREGVSGLYTGLDSALFGIAVTNGVYYFFYEGAKGWLEGRKGRLSTLESMLAGAIAGSFTVLATNPIWVVNTRATANKRTVDEAGDEKTPTPRKPLTIIGSLKEIIKDEGVASLWSGVGPALALVINPVIQYTIFEQLKNTVAKKRALGQWDFFWLGALSKLIATGTTYPYLTIKSRMQLRQSNDAAQRYTLVGGLQKIIREEGIAGLYRGIGAKLLQSVLTAGFLFMFKEQLYVGALKLFMLLSARRTALRAGAAR
ncbi:hypothetical protein YB2330_002124 [Saitoella coloradoensis]